LIRQVYEVNPLVCPGCEGAMKIIAVIEPACAGLLARGAQASTADRRSAIVRQIRSAELATKPVFDDLPIPDPMPG
jgi:hypothetical protein